MDAKKKPQKKKAKTKIVNYTVLDLSSWQVFARDSYMIFNWISLVFLVLILLMYGTLNAHFTYQTPGDSTCALDYGLDVGFWLFVAYAIVNIVNARVSVVVNEKMWSVLTVPLNWITTLYNGAFLLMLYLLYWLTANTPGSSAYRNIANSAYFCGIQANINDLTNDCVKLNPWDVAISNLPGDVDPLNLHANPVFVTLFVFVAIQELFEFLKSVDVLFIPNALDKPKQIFNVLSSLLINYKSVTKDPSKAVEQLADLVNRKKYVKGPVRDVYRKVGFLDVYPGWEKFMYVLVKLLDLSLGGVIIAWICWMSQFTKMYVYGFAAVPNTSPLQTIWTHQFDTFEFFVNLMVVLMAVAWIWCAHLQDIENNYIAIRASIMMLILSIASIVFWFIYVLNCNATGTTWSLCTDPRWCLVSQNNANPANNCIFVGTCPIAMLMEFITVNPHFWAYTVLVFWAFVESIVFLVWARYVETNYIADRSLNERDERRKEQKYIDKDIDDLLSDNTDEESDDERNEETNSMPVQTSVTTANKK